MEVEFLESLFEAVLLKNSQALKKNSIKYFTQIEKELEHFISLDALSERDFEKVNQMSVEELREDVPSQVNTQEETLSNVPYKDSEGFIVVPRVL